MIASVNANFDPNKIYKTHTWERFAKGQTLVGVNESDTTFAKAGNTGGAKTHTLTVNEMPSHTHNVRYTGGSANGIYGGMPGTSVNKDPAPNQLLIAFAGGSAAHNNLQPYVTVYYWKRTA